MKHLLNMGHSLDPILTTSQAAARLGVAAGTVQAWMERGDIASWKTPGGHRRCRLSAVDAIVEQGLVTLDSEDALTFEAALAPEFLPLEQPNYRVPSDEANRLLALARTGLVDTAPEEAWDHLTWLASQATSCPVALVSLLTSTRQWFKSKHGLDVSSTNRELAFCSHAIFEEDGLVVQDATVDERFRQNALVTGAPFIRFYAGVPVRAGGYKIGTLCVIDQQARVLSHDQLKALRALGSIASTLAGRPS